MSGVRDIIAERKLATPAISTATAVAGPPAGTLTNGVVVEYVAACRDAAGNYAIVSSATQGTPTANGVLLLGITIPVAPCRLVIWRGAAGQAASAPTAYIEIPIAAAAAQFYDTGANVNGRPWLTTSIPAATIATNFTFSKLYFTSDGMVIGHGSGTPEGVVTAPIGGLWLRTDGAQGTAAYVKEFSSGSASGWSKLRGNLSVTSKSGSYSVTAADDVVIANGAGITITLLSAATARIGRVFTIKNSGGSNVTVDGGGTNIDGSPTATVAAGAVIRAVSDGSNWFSI